MLYRLSQENNFSVSDPDLLQAITETSQELIAECFDQKGVFDPTKAAEFVSKHLEKDQCRDELLADSNLSKNMVQILTQG